MSFKDLKKRSQENISRLTEELEKMNKGAESYKDDRFWRPELDKASSKQWFRCHPFPTPC